MAQDVGLDFSGYTQRDGVYVISPPRQFAGGEEDYDEQIGSAGKADLLRCGRGAWQLIAHHAKRPIRTLLEIGSGGGTCSLGLIASAPGVQTIITDTSPAFLQMIRRKMKAAGLSMKHTHFATLAGEELNRLPSGTMDAIVIAAALHHVPDWRGFIRHAAALLRPGGVLVIQEPCREGNLMMGIALEIVLSPLWPKDALERADLDRITRCRDAIYYMADSTIEKDGEDKHSFLVTELIAVSEVAGFAGTSFYSNKHFDDLADTDLSVHQGPFSFTDYLAGTLEIHHRLTAGGMQVLRQHLFPMLQRIDARFRNGDGAAMLGCMIFSR